MGDFGYRKEIEDWNNSQEAHEREGASMSEEEKTGGILEIPDNWFVDEVNSDAAAPYIQITHLDNLLKEKRLPMPPSLAYYLRTHSCGSGKMRAAITENAKREKEREIRRVLGL